jgi:GT2 family glycosyltransferase
MPLTTAESPRCFLSASIVTYRSDPRLVGLLASSLAASVRSLPSAQQSCQLFLVCNDSEAPYVHPVRDNLQQMGEAGLALRVLSGHGNIGYGAAHNLACAESDATYHLILNPDVELLEGSLAAALRHLEAYPECVLAAPHSQNEAGHYQRLAKRYPSMLALVLRALTISPESNRWGEHLRRYTYVGVLPAEHPVSIELASGCCMLVRTKELRSVGGFDERFFLFFEDFDLSLRLRSLGKLQELPTFRIIHHGGWATRRHTKRLMHFGRSMLRFYFHHGWKLR